MRTINRKRRQIVTAETVQEEVRPVARALVEHHEHRIGSRMAAYDAVAELVGVSGSWLRKFIGRQDHIGLGAHEYLNILAAYHSICNRLEAAAKNERAKTAMLHGQTGTRDAAMDSDLGMALRTARTSAGSTTEIEGEIDDAFHPYL